MMMLSFLTMMILSIMMGLMKMMSPSVVMTFRWDLWCDPSCVVAAFCQAWYWWWLSSQNDDSTVGATHRAWWQHSGVSNNFATAMRQHLLLIVRISIATLIACREDESDTLSNTVMMIAMYLLLIMRIRVIANTYCSWGWWLQHLLFIVTMRVIANTIIVINQGQQCCKCNTTTTGTSGKLKLFKRIKR